MDQELQLALLGYVVATKKQPKSEQEIMELAKQLQILKQSKNPEEQKKYQQLVQLGQQAQQQQAQKSVKAALGAKLDYLNKLKGICPEGTEKIYLEKGGCMCKKLKASEGAELKKKEQPKNEIQKFKAEKKACGSTLKKKK